MTDSQNTPTGEIFLVENSATQALKLRHALGRLGFTVTIFRAGAEALAALEDAQPLLILCDVALPGMDGYALCRRIRDTQQTRDLPVILLTSFLEPEGVLRALECGADDFLPRVFTEDVLGPLFRDMLANLRSRRYAPEAGEASLGGAVYPLPPTDQPRALSLLLSSYQVAVQRSEQLRDLREELARKDEELERLRQAEPAASEPDRADAAPVPSLRVLLAEDSDVNQRLAVRLLEKQGCAVVVAANGREAVNAWGAQPFDLILMDLEMPVMGGLDATQAIRLQEEGVVDRGIPIVAMTAHDSPEDRERCRAAGMDGFLTKPLNTDALQEVLRRLSAPSDTEDPPSGSDSPADTGVVFDQARALSNVGDDDDLLRELIGLFLDEAPLLLSQARAALAAGDAKAVERAAHSLKGSAASLGALQVVAAAAQVEAAGHGGDLDQAAAAQVGLDAAYVALEAQLKEFLQNTGHNN